MNSPTISIILPNRNYADFIPDAINSIKSQTLSDWECIIIDDASTDNSIDVINKLISGDDRFKLVVNKTPIGISATRNVGLDMARGEYIAFLDSDDCYTEYFLEMLVNAARENNVDIIGATAKIVDAYFHFEKSDDKWNTNEYRVYNNLIDMERAPQTLKWIWIWRRIYKRELLKDIRFHDEMKINGDDITFMLDLLWRVPRVIELNSIGVYHRVHPVSVTSGQIGFNLERVAMFPLFFKYMRENIMDKYDKKFLRLLYKSMFNYMLDECLVKNDIKLTDNDRVEIRKILSRSCKLILKRYLPFKHRLLCGYLSWIK